MIDKKTIIKNIPNAINSISFPKLGKRNSGKVRDWFVRDNLRILIATDRISAFDKVLGTIPFRGAVLNKLSCYWFEKSGEKEEWKGTGLVCPRQFENINCHRSYFRIR